MRLPVLLGVSVTEIFDCDVLGLDGGDPLHSPQLSLFDQGAATRTPAL
jgi:hypothetical protein